MSKVQLSGNVSGTGVFTIASPNSNTDRTLTLPDATGTVQVSGNPISGTTGTFSGLIFANGGGVQFPATQVPSADANCLDDYEEGIWSPTFQNSDGSQSVTVSNAGSYIKIGRQVICLVNVYNTSFASISAGNHIFLRNLPFNADYFAVGSVFSQFPAQPVSITDGAGTQAPLYAPTNAIDFNAFSRNTWGGSNNLTFRGTFAYRASA
jgi:hypothetical protein